MSQSYFFRCGHKQDAEMCAYCPTCGMQRSESKPSYQEWCVHIGLELISNKWIWRTKFWEGENYDANGWKYCPFCGNERPKEIK